MFRPGNLGNNEHKTDAVDPFNEPEGFMPGGSNRKVFETKSPFQAIRLYQHNCPHYGNGHYWLSLGGLMQFHTAECYQSHRNMAKKPLELARKLDRVLVIGGGDGLAARELLRHPQVGKITNVELDHGLIELVRKHPILRKISNDAFNHPRVNLIAGDGLAFLLSSPHKYDVIIDDCEVTVTHQPGGVTQERYDAYRDAVVKKLTPGGVAFFMEALEPNDEYNRIECPAKRKAWLASKIAEEGTLEDWKERTPYVISRSANLPHIGIEHYMYISNAPIKHRRTLR